MFGYRNRKTKANNRARRPMQAVLAGPWTIPLEGMSYPEWFIAEGRFFELERFLWSLPSEEVVREPLDPRECIVNGRAVYRSKQAPVP